VDDGGASVKSLTIGFHGVDSRDIRVASSTPHKSTTESLSETGACGNSFKGLYFPALGLSQCQGLVLKPRMFRLGAPVILAGRPAILRPACSMTSPPSSMSTLHNRNGNEDVDVISISIAPSLDL
jgi:hypothetical protein